MNASIVTNLDRPSRRPVDACSTRVAPVAGPYHQDTGRGMGERDVDKHEVVITGLGIVSPYGTDVERYYDRLAACEIALKPSPLNPDSGLWVSECDDFRPEDWMSEKIIDGTDRFSQFALAGCKQALAHGGLDRRRPRPDPHRHRDGHVDGRHARRRAGPAPARDGWRRRRAAQAADPHLAEHGRRPDRHDLPAARPVPDGDHGVRRRHRRRRPGGAPDPGRARRRRHHRRHRGHRQGRVPVGARRQLAGLRDDDAEHRSRARRAGRSTAIARASPAARAPGCSCSSRGSTPRRAAPRSSPSCAATPSAPTPSTRRRRTRRGSGRRS